MGILFKHQEELEQAASFNNRRTVGTPPPLPVEARMEPKLEVKVEARVEPKADVRPEPKAETRPEPKVQAKVELKVEPKPEPVLEMRRPQLMAVPPPPPEAARVKMHFSVEDFLKLANDLPVRENTALVVRVIEATLSSVNIHIGDIIPEIARRESVVQDRIEATQKRVEDLEVELVERRAELSELENELNDTMELRSLLNHTKAMGDASGKRDASSAETLVLAKASVKSALNG